MKATKIILVLVLLVIVTAGSYWLGQRSHEPASQATTTALSTEKPRKLLYYRNPMGLADTSPVPKKDPMGMDYVAVYAGEDDQGSSATSADPNQIRISTEKIQKLGVRTEPASARMLGKTVRVAARVEPDEGRIYAVVAKFEGYVDRLHVSVTGQAVSKGQALFEAYSPEMVSAQREYVIAAQGMQSLRDAGADAQVGMRQLAESGLARLRNWDLSPSQLAALVHTGQAQRTISFLSPVSGVVTEKKALQGMRFMPGDALYQVTDLSSVWVIADVFEQDIGLVTVGANAKVTFTAYPNKVFEGRVTYVYPTLKAETRTVPVRVELTNPHQMLKPAMFAQVELQVGDKTPVMTVPDSAVIDTGTRRLVLVQLQEGRFEPREITVGRRGENFIEVVTGLREGEMVVVAANFLIDSESNLKAAVGGLSAHASHGSAPKNPDAAMVPGKEQATPMASPASSDAHAAHGGH